MSDDIAGIEVMTEEEAERKAAMIKAAREVADAVDEMKLNLERKGWARSEEAALMLFNTMLMTTFGEQMKSKHEDAKKKFEDTKGRIVQRAFELAAKRGFAHENNDADKAVISTCMNLIMEGNEVRAGSVWDDYFGENTRGSLFAIANKARDEIAEEIEKEEAGK